MSTAATRPWYLPTWVNIMIPVTSPTAQTPSVTRMRSSTGTPPRGSGCDADGLERDALAARCPAGGDEEAVAARLLPAGEGEDVIAALHPGAGRVLAQVHVHPLRAQGLADAADQVETSPAGPAPIRIAS
jgi:hypothetical protein